MKLPLVPFAALASLAQPRGTGVAAAAGAPPSPKDEIAARKLQAAKDAVATLAAVKTRTSDDQKARAAQKVKELKARLQALKMLYANDPKKLAKAATQIARELAGAVKSYTSAGGSAGDLGGADASGTPAGDAAPSGDATNEIAGADTPGSADPEAAAKNGATSEANAAKPTDDKSAADAARDKTDADFKNETRDLARALKAALRRKDAKHRDDDDLRSGEQALASVEQAVGALPMADMAVASAAATA